MNSKKIFIFILGLIITIGSVYWTLNKINLDITKSIISDIGSTNFILLSVIYIFGFLPRGLRSKIMLSPMAYVDFKNAFSLLTWLKPFLILQQILSLLLQLCC